MRNSLEIDLHGQSLKQGEQATIAIIQEAVRLNIEVVKIITGIGNHVLANGTRGVLFKNLPKWVNSAILKPYIKFVFKSVGSFEIFLNTDTVYNNNTIHISESNTAQIKYSDETELMQLIRNSEIDEEERLFLINDMVSKDPNILGQVCSNGTTSLMIAASCNQVKVMSLLLSLEKKFGLKPEHDFKPVLLKQTRQDGTSALMVAVINKHVESIDFLLQKAPSLLKKRRGDGASVFTILDDASYTKEILDALYNHLEIHKREKGYTGLFRDYKIVRAELSIKHSSSNTENKIKLSDDKEFKKYNEKKYGLSVYRMSQFFKHINKNHASFNKLLKQLINFDLNNKIIPLVKREFMLFLKKNHLLKAFLRFNNLVKIRPRAEHQHKLYYFGLNQLSINLPRPKKQNAKRKTPCISKNLTAQELPISPIILTEIITKFRSKLETKSPPRHKKPRATTRRLSIARSFLSGNGLNLEINQLKDYSLKNTTELQTKKLADFLSIQQLEKIGLLSLPHQTSRQASINKASKPNSHKKLSLQTNIQRPPKQKRQDSILSRQANAGNKKTIKQTTINSTKVIDGKISNNLGPKQKANTTASSGKILTFSKAGTQITSIKSLQSSSQTISLAEFEHRKLSSVKKGRGQKDNARQKQGMQVKRVWI